MSPDPNPLEGFIKEACVVDHKQRCEMRDFYSAYLNWANESGITRHQQRPTVKRNLMQLGFTVRHGNQGDKVFGIGLRRFAAIIK